VKSDMTNCFGAREMTVWILTGKVATRLKIGPKTGDGRPMN
jgi:hypothetical protein